MPRPADDYQFGIVGIRQMGDDKAGREDRSRFLRLCQDGIPLVYRPKVWTECSGATETAEPGRYQDLLDEHRGETNQCLAQIDLDIHRTMPTNIYFSGDGPGVPKLRRILAAYSWYSPEVGYCQGMNNLAATLLLTHPSEEEAFWVLVCIIEKILPREYYTSHLLVSQADQRVLLDLIREVLPSLANHLEDLGVDLPAVTFAWFLSLYTDCLPVEVSIRLLLCASSRFVVRRDILTSKIRRCAYVVADAVSSMGPALRRGYDRPLPRRRGHPRNERAQVARNDVCGRVLRLGAQHDFAALLF